jgi:hypothetical protein
MSVRFISEHAIDRWMQRVGTSSRSDARERIATFLAGAHLSRRARSWLGTPHAESRFAYNPMFGGIALLVRHDTVVTVLVRTPETRSRPHRDRPGRRPCDTRPRRFNWRADVAADELLGASS